MTQSDSKFCILYIVRHGQTQWNTKRLIQGESDIPLNKDGEKQAKSLAENLRDIKFDEIYSSDLVRAKRTAELISLERKLAVETTKLLRERRFGKFEGKPWEAMDPYHKIWEGLDKEQRLTFSPDKNYETDGEIISRLTTFLREVSISNLGKTVLVVAHGGMMRVLLNHLSDKTYATGSIENTACIKLKSDGVEFFIEKLSGIKEPLEN